MIPLVIRSEHSEKINTFKITDGRSRGGGGVTDNLACIASVRKTNIMLAFSIDITYSSVISILIPPYTQNNTLRLTTEQQHFLCWHF